VAGVKEGKALWLPQERERKVGKALPLAGIKIRKGPPLAGVKVVKAL
jgi:hypothetical protein